MMFMRKNNIILFGFVIAKMVLQYMLIHPVYDLHRDEYLHLDQAKHPAWGYLSVPPVTSWISAIIGWLGNGVFWVHFFPALFGALTIVVVWKTIEALGGNLFACVLGATAILLSVLVRINILYQPNSLDVLSWMLIYFALIKYISTQKRHWLLLCALFIAVGILNKYNVAFLLLGLLPAILISPQRKLLIQPAFFVAFGLALLLVLPNLYWQYQHHFPVVTFLKKLSSSQLVNVKTSDFIKEQVLFFMGSLFIIVAAFIAFFRYPPFKPYRFFFYSFCFTIGLFIYNKAKGYYAIGLYPVYIAFGSVYLACLFKRKKLRWLQPASIVVIALMFLPLLKIAFPNKTPAAIINDPAAYKAMGLLRWEDGKNHSLPQDFADMQGWRELAAKTDSAYSTVANEGYTIVLCDNYGQAGAINYYSKFKNMAAVSYSTDYVNWLDLTKPIKNVILIQNADDDDPGRVKEKPLFDSIWLSGKINNIYAREKGTSVYVLKGAKADINQRIAGELKEENGF